HETGESDVAEIVRRYVDRQRDRQTTAPPFARLRARTRKYPTREQFDAVRLFRERDELRRRDVTEFRVIPTDQRFRALDPTAAQVVLRLIHERQLRGIDRGA